MSTDGALDGRRSLIVIGQTHAGVTVGKAAARASHLAKGRPNGQPRLGSGPNRQTWELGSGPNRQTWELGSGPNRPPWGQTRDGA
jgi:hypothetical protein